MAIERKNLYGKVDYTSLVKARNFLAEITQNALMKKVLTFHGVDADNARDVFREAARLKLITNSLFFSITKEFLKDLDYLLAKLEKEVKNQAREYSDLDICYYEEMPWNVFSRLKEDLEKSYLPFRVDLEHLNNCACLEQQAKEIYELFASSLRKMAEKIKECACKKSEKIRVDSDYYAWCEKCESAIPMINWEKKCQLARNIYSNSIKKEVIGENTYQHLKQKVGYGKISSFVNRAVEKELRELNREQKKEQTQLKKRLIAAYQRQAKNKKLQKELILWEKVSVEFPPTLEDRKPIRPCLVISDNIQNEYENTPETGLDYPSKLLFNYPRTVDRERLKEHLGAANEKIMNQAKKAWKIAFACEE
ncbi:662_t:CDS:2 [Funneliformis geosporum]|nr:662_t:CDS:2 [Funneliformis geosporum]